MLEKYQSLLKGIDQIRTIELESALRPFFAKPGEIIYRSGESTIGLYLIEQGFVEVHHSGLAIAETPELRMTKGPGDYFGEMGLIDRRRRNTVITAVTNVRGRYLDETKFTSFIQREPHLLLNLVRDVLLRTTEHDSELIRELIRTKQAAERYIKRLKALSVASQLLNTTLDLDDLLETLLQLALTHVEADRGTVYLVERETDEIVSKVLEGEQMKEIRLPLGSGIAGHVAQTGEIISIDDAYSDERFNSSVDKETGYETNTILAVPMRDQNHRIVGVMQLLNKKTGSFNPQDQEFLLSLGTHGSIAIEKARMAKEMAQNQSLVAIGGLASSIIHDFKNPMTLIRGYAQMISDKFENDDPDRKYLDIIVSQVDRLVGMTQEVLDFSRDDIHVEIAQLNLVAIIRGLNTTIREECDNKSIEFSFKTDVESLPVALDGDRFARVFYNLTANALDAMPDSGELSLSLTHDEESWTLQISDTGKGIPEDRLPDIFEPFNTFGKNHGTGLGLAIVKNIVTAHNGSVNATSTENEGTTITLCIPVVPKNNGNTHSKIPSAFVQQLLSLGENV